MTAPLRISALVVALAALLCTGAQAQTFPSKPLRLVVPFASGGVLDLMGRQVAHVLSDTLQQTVVVENVPGAGGGIGIANVKNASPDGHTLILLEPGVLITPIFDPTATFNLRRDLEIVSIIAEAPLVLGINAAVPAKTLPEFVALLRAQPGKFNFSTPGVGTAVHMTSELFKAETGVDIVHVPYRGGAAAIADLLDGRVQMTFLGATALRPYFIDGRMRGLASTGPRRSRLLPDLPTFAEAGFPKVQVTFWTGLFVAKGTPPAIVTRLQQAVKAATSKDEFRAFLAKSDFEPLDVAGPDADRFIAQEETKWTGVVKASQHKK